MDLELADYQRSIESLKLQLQERENTRRDMDKRISLQQKQIDQLKKDLGVYEYYIHVPRIGLIPDMVLWV